jgi:hypothetical protein
MTKHTHSLRVEAAGFRRAPAPTSVRKGPPSQTTSLQLFKASTYDQIHGPDVDCGDRQQCLQEVIARLPAEAARAARKKTRPFEALHGRLLNDPDSIRFDRNAILTLQAPNVMFDGESEPQTTKRAHSQYSEALRRHLGCIVGDDGAFSADESQIVLRGIQSYLVRYPNADLNVHLVANALKRLVACSVSGVFHGLASSVDGVYVEQLLRNPTVPQVLIHGTLGDPDRPDANHAVIIELHKRRGPPNKLDAIVFNTGYGCSEDNGHRRVGSAADSKWTTSVTFRDIPAKAMTLPLIQKLCTEEFPSHGPQSLYSLLGNLSGAWRDDKAPAVVQARQKRGDCTFKVHLALIKYHTGDALYRSLRAEIYTTSLADVYRELGDKVNGLHRVEAKTAYMQAKALRPLSAEATERYRRGFKSRIQLDREHCSRYPL